MRKLFLWIIYSLLLLSVSQVRDHLAWCASSVAHARMRHGPELSYMNQDFGERNNEKVQCVTSNNLSAPILSPEKVSFQHRLAWASEALSIPKLCGRQTYRLVMVQILQQ